MSNLLEKIRKNLSSRGLGFNGYLTEVDRSQHIDLIKPLYDNAFTLQDKLLASVVCSLLTQKNRYFFVARDRLNILLLKDWNIRMHNYQFKLVYSILANCGLFSIVETNIKRKPSIFKVTDKTLINALGLTQDDTKTQLETAYKYINRLSSQAYKDELQNIKLEFK
jgi:hypothetical protein